MGAGVVSGVSEFWTPLGPAGGAAVGYMAELARTSLDSSVALVVVTMGVGFGMGAVWGMVICSVGMDFGLE